MMIVMKLLFSIIFIVVFAFSALGQTPSATPRQPDGTEKPTLKNFGSSLKRYEKKQPPAAKNNLPDNPEDSETIRVKTNLVVSDVLVVNDKGNIITGLQSSDFTVTEDNQPQTIEVFSSGADASVPKSIVLIIDRSGSLAPYLKNSFDAAQTLIDKLGPNDRMAIVTDDVKLIVEFTKDKTVLKNSIEEMKKRFLHHGDGLSHQYSALLAVLNEMFDDEDIRPIVIVQSDGDEIANLKPQATDFPIPVRIRTMLLKNEGERPYGYQELLAAVKKSRATIYSIIPGVRLLGYPEAERLKRSEMIAESIRHANGIGKPLFFLQPPKDQQLETEQLFLARQNSMFEIANLAGGYTDYIEKPEDAENVYSTIFTVIGNRYIIGYYSPSQEPDGKRHIVKVEVRGHPEYVVTGRKSYYAR